MKRLFRAVTALLSAILLGWYCIPAVYRTLHLPDQIDASLSVSAPAMGAERTDVYAVSGSRDERLRDVSGQLYSIRLLGVLPLRTVYAAARQRTVCAGGEAFGVVLKTDGVQIVGIGYVDAEEGRISPAQEAGLKEGDVICSVNGETVTDTRSFIDLCEKAGDSCTLSCLREDTPFTVTLRPAADSDGVKRIGAWVRDSTSGIGTLSFYDASSRRFTALGHGVTDVDTGKLIAPATGFLSEVRLTGIRTGDADNAGELLGQFSDREADAIASVEQNTAFGIAGTLSGFTDPNETAIGIAPAGAAHLGDAIIRSTIDSGGVREYRVRVIRVDVQSSPETQGMMIEITDDALLEKTNGIVQGMSGSPLIQDGRLIGVVTHVFVSRPTRGYCLYADWMAQKLLPST